MKTKVYKSDSQLFDLLKKAFVISINQSIFLYE